MLEHINNCYNAGLEVPDVCDVCRQGEIPVCGVPQVLQLQLHTDLHIGIHFFIQIYMGHHPMTVKTPYLCHNFSNFEEWLLKNGL